MKRRKMESLLAHKSTRIAGLILVALGPFAFPDSPAFFSGRMTFLLAAGIFLTLCGIAFLRCEVPELKKMRLSRWLYIAMPLAIIVIACTAKYLGSL